MPHYSPYGNRLVRLWAFAALALFVLSLGLGVAVVSNARTHVLELFLVAFAIPATFAALIVSNGYGMLSPHSGRMNLRILLAVSGLILFTAGIYVSYGFARSIEDDAVFIFVLRLLPFLAVICLLGLGVIRLSTRLRRSTWPSEYVAAGGILLMIASVTVSLWLGYQSSGEQLQIAMLVGVTPLGLSVVATTLALRQAGRHRSARALGIFGSIAIGVITIVVADWVGRTAERDYLYVAISIALAPLSLAALNWRISHRFSRWPIWASMTLAILSIAMGLWAALAQDELVDIFLFAMPDVTGTVNGFAWVWLAKALPSLSIALYAIFCIEEPWQWWWERMRLSRRTVQETLNAAKTS